MTEFDVYREFPESLDEEGLAGAVEACGAELERMRAEGADLSYLGTEVLLDDDGGIAGTVCCFDGESREQVEELNERAGLPFVRTYRRGDPIAGEREKRTA